jgi:hypothetical protein
MMTEQQADDLLENNDWSKWSDARYLLQTAASIGGKDTAISIAMRLETQGQSDLAEIVRKKWG